ncbi:MAG: FAD-dependent oxidoreductase [Akkermansiaceae bacterium]|nr:FAD-dependent oxidoreductase [Armatimonadota bacterium]
MNPSDFTDTPHPVYYYPLPAPQQVLDIDCDLCIYGGTSAGVAAAIQARRMGKSVALLAFDRHIGGLSSGGLGATDIGNKAVIGGISREFYRRMGRHYGTGEAWKFEPTVAEETLRIMCAEVDVPIYFDQRLTDVEKDSNRITAIRTEGGHRFRATYFVDASYEGDLLAKAGVSYTVGREPNSQYEETLNGVQYGHPKHNFKVPVDPFVRPGEPASGLLRGISAEPPGEHGQGDHRVQAYNFRLCMTQAPNRIPFPKPDGYEPERFELLARYLSAGIWDVFGNNQMMPNGKTDTNNNGGFSSDNIGENYGWPEGDYETRERIFQDHVTYHQGMMWFLCHDARVPNEIRTEVNQWGLPRDEFVATGGWPHQLYIREARRMISDYVMTEADCRWQRAPDDSVGMGAYGMDSHNCQRIAREEDGVWTARNEGDVQIPVKGPYPVSYRSLVPQTGECENLLVPVCLSASHIAFGSIRMEPVFFVLGQSVATAACLAMDAGNIAVQSVGYAKLRGRLLADGQILGWNPLASTEPDSHP